MTCDPTATSDATPPAPGGNRGYGTRSNIKVPPVPLYADTMKE
jgi:hypothetical protein